MIKVIVHMSKSSRDTLYIYIATLISAKHTNMINEHNLEQEMAVEPFYGQITSGRTRLALAHLHTHKPPRVEVYNPHEPAVRPRTLHMILSCFSHAQTLISAIGHAVALSMSTITIIIILQTEI